MFILFIGYNAKYNKFQEVDLWEAREHESKLGWQKMHGNKF